MDKNNTVDRELSTDVWLYDGIPENISLQVDPLSPEQGGYVLVLHFGQNDLRLAATRNPAHYMAGWRHTAKRYGLTEADRVLISRPHLRYEAVKRRLSSLLADHADQSGVYRISLEGVTKIVGEVFGVATGAIEFYEDDED